MPHDEHGFQVVTLRDLILGQQRRVEPAGRRDACRLHELLVGEARQHPVVLDLPDAAPVLPGAFGEAVVERQRHDIEAEVGRTLHVGVATEDIGSHARPADVAGGKQQDAACADVGRADRVLGLAHGPDQARGPLLGEHLGDALELLARHAGNALDLLGIPLLDLLADVVHAVDALLDELLVLPPVLEDVPEHAPKHGNVRARTQAHIFGGVCRGPGQPRIGDDEVRAIELLAFEQVLQRHGMRFRRIAAEEEQRLGVADVGVAVGHRAVAPGIGYAGNRRRMANARLVIDVVGSPERGELAVEIGALVGELGGAQPVDRVRSGLAADLHQLVADLVDRLIPRDFLPLSARELHRVAQATVAQHHLARGGTLGAVRAAADRAIPARLLADPHAVLDLGDDGAADRAMRADVLAQDRCPARRGTGRLGLAHGSERQGAERGKTTGCQAGLAQEGAAVDASAGLRCERGSKRAAACMAF